MKHGRPLAVVLMGYDGLGAQQHQLDMYEPAFQNHPEWEIVAVSDFGDSPERRRCARDRAVHLEVPFLEPKDAIAIPGVDLISACVAFERRVEIAQLAAAAGVHVLVDKPAAFTLNDIDHMMAAADAANILCVPAHHLRFRESIQRAIATVERGDLGTLRAIRADFIVTAGAALANADKPTAWPGGELMNFVVYPVDTIIALTGRAPLQVVASRGGYFFGGEHDEDFGVLSVMLEDDIHASIAVGRAPMPGHLDGLTHRYRLIGSKGVIDVDATDRAIIVHGAGRSRTLPYSDDVNSVATLVGRLADAVRGERPPPATLADARASLAVTLAARESSDSGQVVTIPYEARPNNGDTLRTR